MKLSTIEPKIIPAFPALKRARPDVLQMNLGLFCNQTCGHCHVSAGPERTEKMSATVADDIIALAKRYPFKVADITGGAPELMDCFYPLVEELSALTEEVKVRANLTAAYTRRERFLATVRKHRPTIIASMPCYMAENVDKQRGDGIFDKSIRSLQWLNELGYGRGNGRLDLVYNPLGATLPPAAEALEANYKRELKKHFDIDFDQLLTITNAPVGRFAEQLRQAGEYDLYLDRLATAHNPDNLAHVMCRSYLSVNWDGHIFDCDFNVALGWRQEELNLKTLDPASLVDRAIRVGAHCYCCTAGTGSSCAGTLQT